MGLFSRFKKSIVGEGANPPARERSDDVAEASNPPVQAASDLAANTATPGGGEAVLTALKLKVAELSSGQMSPELIDPAVSLFDYGYVDSLSAVTLISFVDETYGVSVTELDLVGELGSIQALTEHIERLQGA
jgi:acyl carrier protein